MNMRKFKNENTYINFQKKGKLDLYNELYEKALTEVKTLFGKEYPNIINGEEIIEPKKFDDITPIDGETVLGKFQLASQESLNKAIEASKKGYKDWYKLGYVRRANIFLKAADAMSKNKFFYAALVSYENGKNRHESLGDVDEAIDFMRYYALDLLNNKGYIRKTGQAYEGETSKSVMKPFGVFAVLPPFNFFSITVGMISGALVTGNAAIVKPSSDIPLSTYLYVKDLLSAGVPKNVVHYVAGSGSIVGKGLVEDERIDGTVFTGSRDVGMYIYRKTAEIKTRPVITEMGGKNAIIVTDKANMDKAVEGVARAAFGYGGQKCSACSRIYVHEKIEKEFTEKLIEFTKKLVVDDPTLKDTFMGPVINKEAYEKFKKYSEICKKDGKILYGGETLNKKGYYVMPTIVSGLNDDHEVMRTELFLPIVAVRPVKSLDEALYLTNRLDYGLTGGIFTEDKDEIEKYFDEIETGVVYANRKRGGSTGAMVGSQPFVGWKMSGTTGKGTGSFYYLQQFLREQSQTVVE